MTQPFGTWSTASRQLGAIVVLAVVVAVGTWWIGWWAAPVFGLGWGAARYGAYPARTAGVAAALGWMLLLGYQATQGPMGEVSRTVAGVLGTPGWLPIAAAALFPAALAATGARLSGAIMPLLEGMHAPPPHAATQDAVAPADAEEEPDDEEPVP